MKFLCGKLADELEKITRDLYYVLQLLEREFTTHLP